MKYLVTTVAVLIGLFSATHARADEHHKSWFKFFMGQWNYEWTAEEGMFSEKGEYTVNAAAKGHALSGQVHTLTGDREIEVAGWQSDAKAIVFTGFSSNRGYWHISYDDVQEDRLSGPAHGVLPDGRAWKSKFVLTRKGGDGFEIRAEGTADGKALVTLGKFTRKKTDAPSSHYEQLKELEWWAGTWVVEGKLPDGTEYRGEQAWAWSLGNNFLVGSLTSKKDGKDTLESTTIVGWDLATEQIKGWEFWRDVYRGEFIVTGGGTTFVGNGRDNEGKQRFSGKLDLSDDKRSYDYTATIMTEDGRKLVYIQKAKKK